MLLIPMWTEYSTKSNSKDLPSAGSEGSFAIERFAIPTAQNAISQFEDEVCVLAFNNNSRWDHNRWVPQRQTDLARVPQGDDAIQTQALEHLRSCFSSSCNILIAMWTELGSCPLFGELISPIPLPSLLSLRRMKPLGLAGLVGIN